MSIEEIAHLDHTSPFDVIEAVESAIRLARHAMAAQLETLMADAKKDCAEQHFTDGLSFLWSALEAFTASVEETP